MDFKAEGTPVNIVLGDMDVNFMMQVSQELMINPKIRVAGFASTGDALIERASSLRADAVLINYSMTDMTAVDIVKQLRLRDIGGIIIIDFIDMNSQDHQKMVIDTLETELKKDRTKANVLGITNLGLVEMTRKKVRQSLDEVLEKVCPYCEGRGRILSEETMAKKVEREISRIFRTRRGEAILLEVHPSVAAVAIGAGGSRLAQLEQRHGKYIFIKGKDDLHPEEIRVKAVGSRVKLENFAMPVREGQIIDVTIEETHITNPNDGIARVDGYVIDVEEGADLLGEKVKVQINKIYRTYAKARLI
jgi:ribonuclease G